MRVETGKAPLPLEGFQNALTAPFGSTITDELDWRQLVLGFGAMLFLVFVHAVHDVYDGDGMQRSILSSGPILFQMGVLTWGYRWGRHRAISLRVLTTAGLMVSFVLGFLFIFLHTQVPLNSTLRFVTEPQPPDFNWVTMSAGAVSGAAGFVFWLLVFCVPDIVHQARLRVVEAESMRREGALMRLRSSLEPHFMLNTLNAVAGLVVREPKQARSLLAAFGELLRDAVDEGPEERSFADDVKWLERYAAVLEVRHRGRLTFVWDPAPDTLDIRLPRLLLQPLLENAVKHGALLNREGGIVTIRSERRSEGACFIVADNGPGISENAQIGLGLRLVVQRLALAYPDGTFSLSNTSSGCRATVTVPIDDRKVK